MRLSKKFLTGTLFCVVLSITVVSEGLEFQVSYPSEIDAGAIDGRIILLLSTDDSTEPRFQSRPGVRAIQIFGVDVDTLVPGSPVAIDSSVFGYPIEKLDDLQPGEYNVQAVLHRYETFHRSDGHTV